MLDDILAVLHLISHDSLFFRKNLIFNLQSTLFEHYQTGIGAYLYTCLNEESIK